MPRKNGHRNFQGTANPEYAEGMREIRRSNAAGLHQDRRERRSRTRSAGRDKAVKDSYTSA